MDNSNTVSSIGVPSIGCSGGDVQASPLFTGEECSADPGMPGQSIAPLAVAAALWRKLQGVAILRGRITSLGRRDAYARVAHLLCEMFERLTTVGETVDHNYRLPVMQEELSDTLGLSEVHANRMLRRLERERLIVYEGRHLRIPDLDALTEAARFSPSYLHLDGAPRLVRDALSLRHVL